MQDDNQASRVPSERGIEFSHPAPELLNTTKYNIRLEQAFNCFWSKEFPHCSQCAVISSRKEIDRPYGSHMDVKLLLTCRDCLLCVHSSCYGIEVAPCNLSTWQCDKCKEGKQQEICCLCSMRGGAVKKTADGRWAHMLCAMCIPGVTYDHVVPRENINISNVDITASHKKCAFCKKSGGGFVTCGGYSKCKTFFHATCGLVSGVEYELNKWSKETQLKARCTEHSIRSKSACGVDVELPVWARHNNGRYYKGRVHNVDEVMFYLVIYTDGSFSDDVRPHDVLNYNCTANGPPPVGSEIKVANWRNSSTYYIGTYLGWKVKIMFKVRFDDGSTILVSRKDIYNDREIPVRPAVRD